MKRPAWFKIFEPLRPLFVLHLGGPYYDIVRVFIKFCLNHCANSGMINTSNYFITDKEGKEPL